MKKNNIPRLTDLELLIMKVMWESDDNITIQKIADTLSKTTKTHYSAASITQAITRLKKKQVVEVKEHILVSNVYARTFSPCFSGEDFFAAEIKRLERNVFGVRKGKEMGVIAALVSSGNVTAKDMEEVKQMLAEAEKQAK